MRSRRWRKGAFDFIAKPIDSEILKIIIDRALRMCELEEENKQLRELSARATDGLVYRLARKWPRSPRSSTASGRWMSA